MKKTYESPSIEKVAFMYRDQVVVASGDIPTGTCSGSWIGQGSNETTGCSFTVVNADGNMN